MYGYHQNDLTYYCDRFKEYESYGTDDRIKS